MGRNTPFAHNRVWWNYFGCEDTREYEVWKEETEDLTTGYTSVHYTTKVTNGSSVVAQVVIQGVAAIVGYLFFPLVTIGLINTCLTDNQYLQSICEVLVFKHFKEFKEYEIFTEQKINGVDDKDVDVIAKIATGQINIEIKAPDIIKHEEGKLHGYNGHFRLSNDKSKYASTQTRGFNEIEEIFKNAGKETQKMKNDDNKLKDYLESANNKMPPINNSDMNILFLGLETRNMELFLLWLVNHYTGGLSNNSYIDKSKFNKIDAIILSNCIQGHIEQIDAINKWNLGEYITFILPLQDTSGNAKNIACEHLVKTLGNEFLDYVTFLKQEIKELEKNGIEPEVSEYMIFSDYLAKVKPNFKYNK